MPLPTIIDAAKGVADLARAYDKMDLYKQAVDLQSQINDLAGENFKAQQENLTLKKRIAELEEQLSEKVEMKYDDGFYYKAGNGQQHCPTCWLKDQKAVPMRFADDELGFRVFECPVDRRHSITRRLG